MMRYFQLRSKFGIDPDSGPSHGHHDDQLVKPEEMVLQSPEVKLS